MSKNCKFNLKCENVANLRQLMMFLVLFTKIMLQLIHGKGSMTTNMMVIPTKIAQTAKLKKNKEKYMFMKVYLLTKVKDLLILLPAILNFFILHVFFINVRKTHTDDPYILAQIVRLFSTDAV